MKFINVEALLLVQSTFLYYNLMAFDYAWEFPFFFHPPHRLSSSKSINVLSSINDSRFLCSQRYYFFITGLLSPPRNPSKVFLEGRIISI